MCNMRLIKWIIYSNSDLFGVHSLHQCENIDRTSSGCCTKQTVARMHVRVGKRISGDTTRDLILTVTTIPRVHMKTGKRERSREWRDSFIWQQWESTRFRGVATIVSTTVHQILTGGWRYSLKIHRSMKMICSFSPLSY